MAFTVYENTRDRKATEDHKGVRRYTRSWDVISDSVYTGPLQVKKAVPCQIGQPYTSGTDDDPKCLCVSLDAAMKDPGDRINWTVTAEFSNDKEVSSDSFQDPCLLPPEVDITGQMGSKVIAAGWPGQTASTQNISDQRTFVSSAGESLGFHEIDDPRLIVQFRRNVRWVNLQMLWLYRNAVNSDPFMLFGIGVLPGYAKLGQFSVRRDIDQNQVPFYIFGCEIHLKGDGWILQLRDQGTRWVVPGFFNNQPHQYVDPSTGLPYTTPQPLNGTNGQLLPDADILAGKFAVRYYKVYPELPFSNLGLFV